MQNRDLHSLNCLKEEVMDGWLLLSSYLIGVRTVGGASWQKVPVQALWKKESY